MTISTLAVPAAAIAAFERLSGLTVTVHDHAGQLGRQLPAGAHIHRHPLCQAVKARHEHDCVRWDVHRLNQDLAYLGEGRIQVCHAGHGELVVPVVQRGRAVAVLFAGPFRCAQAPATVDGVRTAWRGRSPPELPASRVDDLLELLRQLAARLACWLEGQAGSEPPLVGPSPLHRAHVLAQRRFAILQFIREQATRPVDGADLARALGLSLSRTKHVVQEACGAGFNQLLLSARLEAAADLLRHTDLPILETALRSGFNDSSHFHRRFRTRFGATPAVFRRNATRREA